jgi:lysophospholipase L1-like esterase
VYSLLSLGDSYTIGEGVPLYDSFPYQTVQLLRRKRFPFFAPEIVARTGWTTDELAAAINRTQLLPRYDVVSLLIGVNNQYRGRDLQEYAGQFEQLLQQAIRLAGESSRVFVLSIPDWGITTFAETTGRDRASIAAGIDAFNSAAERIVRSYGPSFIDITGLSRKAAGETVLFAEDGLHPGGQQYSGWADLLAERIERVFQ